jgi:hypothetical protein
MLEEATNNDWDDKKGNEQIQEFFFNENDDASGRDNKDNAKDNENNIETRIFPKPTLEMPHNLSLISLYANPFMLSFLVFNFNFISQV